ncbi:hypothetical protein VTK56DRAFT_4121 [Thermocarpiscus australiensis]
MDAWEIHRGWIGRACGMERAALRLASGVGAMSNGTRVWSIGTGLGLPSLCGVGAWYVGMFTRLCSGLLRGGKQLLRLGPRDASLLSARSHCLIDETGRQMFLELLITRFPPPPGTGFGGSKSAVKVLTIEEDFNHCQQRGAAMREYVRCLFNVQAVARRSR